MPLPADLNTGTLYDEYLDLKGRAVLGTGVARYNIARKSSGGRFTILPVAIPFNITPVPRIVDGASITFGYWEVTLPLGVDSDYVQNDTVTITLSLTDTDPLITGVGPYTVLLRASDLDGSGRARLSDLTPATPGSTGGASGGGGTGGGTSSVTVVDNGDGTLTFSGSGVSSSGGVVTVTP